MDVATLVASGIARGARAIHNAANGRFVETPTGVAKAYVQPQGKLHFLANGGNPVYEASVDYCARVQEGAEEAVASYQAGVRSGIFALVNCVHLMMHKISAGTIRNLMSAGGAGIPSMAEAMEDPAAAGVGEFQMLTQGEYAVLLGMVPLMHRGLFPSWENFDAAGQVFNQPYWSDEVVLVADDQQFSQQVAASWADADTVALFNQGLAETSIWLEAIAMHRLKNRNHSWFTPLARNNVFNELLAAHAAAHGQSDVRLQARSAHDMLHAFRGLVPVYITAQLIPGIRALLLTSASPFRYPPTDPGAALFVNFEKAADQVLNGIKYRQLAGPAFLMASVIHSASLQVSAAVVADPTAFNRELQTGLALDVLVNRKALVRKSVAWLLGMASAMRLGYQPCPRSRFP